MKTIDETYKDLDAILKPASIAKVGGFRPPNDPLTSKFGGNGVGSPGEQLPKYNGKDMFCLLQVKVSELPVIPKQLEEVEMLLVFMNRKEVPFEKPHGDGWKIREYKSLEGLSALPKSNEPDVVKEFPIKWKEVLDDTPDWENAWELIDLTPINDADDERFFEEYSFYSETKFGGYPGCIQHGHNLDGFVFQIGSEEKANWMWIDNGIAYFNKNQDGMWEFDCQFY